MANKSYETLNRLYEELGAILSAANIPAAEDSTDEVDLDAMSYGDLKKLCKSRGLSAKGSRDELIAALTDAADGSDEDEPEEKPAKKRGGKKKSEPEPEPEDEDEDDSDDEADEEDIQSQVESAVADMSLEELAEFCEENGLSSKGKRQALISRIVKAVEKGDIELSDGDDEDDEEEEEPPKKSKKSGGKKSKKDEEPDEDEDDSDDEAEPTKERAAALKKYKKDTKAQFKNGEIERDELVEFLCDFHGEKKSAYKKMSDEEVLEAYIDASSNMIDDVEKPIWAVPFESN